jgi:2-polyprenyl-3-methyl-5-hydroxy-6-metoxy-1,4-benzoquinol methylase
MNLVKEFYDTNPFPGEYTWAQLMNVGYPPQNRYLSVIDRYLEDNQTVLDVGCGTGLITNLFATRYQSSFVGLDFSRGIDIAEQFAKINRITNVKYVKEDFNALPTNIQFDVVIAQSFLTHARNPVQALHKLKMHVAPGGTLIFSVYNPAGQILKKICNLNYRNQRLALDQLYNPLDNTYSDKDVRSTFKDWKLQEIMPSINDKFITVTAFINSRNGGLTNYVFKNE